MKKMLVSVLFLLLLAVIISGCTKPNFIDAKFQQDFIGYNENATVNYQIENPGDTSFEGKVEIQAVIQSGFFNCFDSTPRNISTILPGKTYNGDILIISKNNENCKAYNFDVYVTLKDLKSDEILQQKILSLKVKG